MSQLNRNAISTVAGNAPVITVTEAQNFDLIVDEIVYSSYNSTQNGPVTLFVQRGASKPLQLYVPGNGIIILSKMNVHVPAGQTINLTVSGMAATQWVSLRLAGIIIDDV